MDGQRVVPRHMLVFAHETGTEKKHPLRTDSKSFARLVLFPFFDTITDNE